MREDVLEAKEALLEVGRKLWKPQPGACWLPETTVLVDGARPENVRLSIKQTGDDIRIFVSGMVRLAPMKAVRPAYVSVEQGSQVLIQLPDTQTIVTLLDNALDETVAEHQQWRLIYREIRDEIEAYVFLKRTQLRKTEARL